MCSASLSTSTLWPDKQKCSRLKLFLRKIQTRKGQTQVLDRLYTLVNVTITKMCMQVRQQTQLKISFVSFLGDSNTGKIFSYGIFLASCMMIKTLSGYPNHIAPKVLGSDQRSHLLFLPKELNHKISP